MDLLFCYVIYSCFSISLSSRGFPAFDLVVSISMKYCDCVTVYFHLIHLGLYWFYLAAPWSRVWDTGSQVVSWFKCSDFSDSVNQNVSHMLMYNGLIALAKDRVNVCNGQKHYSSC